MRLNDVLRNSTALISPGYATDLHSVQSVIKRLGIFY